MPLNFVWNVESGMSHLGSDDWLTPASVDGLTDADFVTLPTVQRRELFRCANEFRVIADATPHVDVAQKQAAEAALKKVWELLRPYRTKESKAIGDVLWAAWQDERMQDWVPTFDYQLGEDWSGDPAVRVWLILDDGVDTLAAKTRESVSRFELLVRARLQDAEIDRYPFVWTRLWSQVTGPDAKVPA